MSLEKLPMFKLWKQSTRELDFKAWNLFYKGSFAFDISASYSADVFFSKMTRRNIEQFVL